MSNFGTPAASADALPSAESTLPFWRTELHPLDSHRTTEDLPQTCDILIIGGGYAGIATAYHLLCDKSLTTEPKPSIVLLEARQACSGATARNGGHLRPAVYSRLPSYIQQFGVEAAAEIADFEFDHVRAVKELVEKELIECEFTLTKSFDTYTDPEAVAVAKAAYLELNASGVAKKTLDDLEWFDAPEAEKITGFKGCVGCFRFSAAKLWPYKLIMGLLERSVEEGLNLQTNTPALSFRASTLTLGAWDVGTPRGIITAKQIIFATNGYTAGLLPEYEKKIVPSKGTCCRIVCPPGVKYPEMKATYGLRLPNGGGDYLIQRPDGSIIVGGARSTFFSDHNNWYNHTDDSTLIAPAKDYFSNYMQRHFRGWEGSGAHVDQIWTGIMGYTSDMLPSVGEVPNRKNVWIEAGFEGHGMPVIWLVAKGIAELVAKNKEYASVRLPRLWKTTESRLRSDVNFLGPKK